MAVITANDWARVWAKAALEARPTSEGGKGDPSFRAKLEIDPLLAYREFRQQFSDTPDSDVLCNNIDAYEKEETGMMKFSDMSVEKLQGIINNNSPAARVEYNELKNR